MRQVSPQKPQRSAVSSESSFSTKFSRSGDSSDSPTDRHTFPPTALALMLVVGVLLGLLLAAVISSFVDGSGSKSRAAGTAATASPSPGSQSAAQSIQRTDEIRANSKTESRDVRIFGCGVDANGYASANVLITNSTERRATYYVRIIFTSASDGRTISDDVASIKRLPPGSTSPIQSVHAIDQAAGEQVLCRLGSVSRF